MPSMAFSPWTIRSRRRRNSATIRSTESCGPRSAAAPATWVKAAAQEVALVASWVMRSASGVGITP